MIDSLVAAATRRRRARAAAGTARRRVLARPVISVGNVSMGGSGKSPLVAHLARLLLEKGHKPAVLSRGYARPHPVDGAVVVSDGSGVLAEYDVAGDEPLMLARQLPGCAVVVSPDRYLGGTLAERRLGCTVHILDDGFQHLQLARTLDLVIVRGEDLKERVMPLGRLREPLDSVRAADAVIVDPDDGIDAAVRELGAPRMFHMSRRLGEPRTEPAFAFAGIARPREFFDALSRSGWALAGSNAFADHHRYSPSELAAVSAEAKRAGARMLVTTEKDAARFTHEIAALEALPIVTVPLAVSVEPAAEFAHLVAQACDGSLR